jgi:metal-responsive CopG/Arc/MetJ family transcriptional regulator
MYQQINITLPQKTIELIDSLTAQEDRSQLIDEAINFYVIDRQNNYSSSNFAKEQYVEAIEI